MALGRYGRSSDEDIWFLYASRWEETSFPELSTTLSIGILGTPVAIMVRLFSVFINDFISFQLLTWFFSWSVEDLSVCYPPFGAECPFS